MKQMTKYVINIPYVHFALPSQSFLHSASHFTMKIK